MLDKQIETSDNCLHQELAQPNAAKRQMKMMPATLEVTIDVEEGQHFEDLFPKASTLLFLSLQLSNAALGRHA